ncbi:DsbA family protein [Magnetovibrio sp. PR-2]|uniref:DsbA family protein n=1 Tax=Magnetovibrio sp. PR-2 TaxID=3120356 RepID=UPI002FCE2BB3
MSIGIEFFASLSSPYCYFTLDRLDEMVRDQGLQIVMRPVLPGVLRMSDFWSSTPHNEVSYFERDVARTADYLGLPYAPPSPTPLAWSDYSVWRPSSDQDLIYRLCNMLFQAHELSKGYELYSALMRLIWAGRTPGWDKGEHLAACLETCGLPVSLSEEPHTLTAAAENFFASNQQALFECGHWGVPTMSLNGEPFFGQDRIDQLRWRIDNLST